MMLQRKKDQLKKMQLDAEMKVEKELGIQSSSRGMHQSSLKPLTNNMMSVTGDESAFNLDEEALMPIDHGKAAKKLSKIMHKQANDKHIELIKSLPSLNYNASKASVYSRKPTMRFQDHVRQQTFNKDSQLSSEDRTHMMGVSAQSMGSDHSFLNMINNSKSRRGTSKGFDQQYKDVNDTSVQIDFHHRGQNNGLKIKKVRNSSVQGKIQVPRDQNEQQNFSSQKQSTSQNQILAVSGAKSSSQPRRKRITAEKSTQETIPSGSQKPPSALKKPPSGVGKRKSSNAPKADTSAQKPKAKKKPPSKYMQEIIRLNFIEFSKRYANIMIKKQRDEIVKGLVIQQQTNEKSKLKIENKPKKDDKEIIDDEEDPDDFDLQEYFKNSDQLDLLKYHDKIMANQNKLDSQLDEIEQMFNF